MYNSRRETSFSSQLFLCFLSHNKSNLFYHCDVFFGEILKDCDHSSTVKGSPFSLAPLLWSYTHWRCSVSCICSTAIKHSLTTLDKAKGKRSSWMYVDKLQLRCRDEDSFWLSWVSCVLQHRAMDSIRHIDFQSYAGIVILYFKVYNS